MHNFAPTIASETTYHGQSLVQAFASLASFSGGKSGRLDGSAEMIDMAARAMLAKLKGGEGVKAYMDYHVGSRASKFGQLLLEGPKK